MKPLTYKNFDAGNPDVSYEVLTLPDRDRLEPYFLKLPKLLYAPEHRTQDTKAERALLRGTHPLSPDITCIPFVLVTPSAANPAKREPLARCMLTYYPDDPAAYLGFFECAPNQSACRTLLAAAEERARADGKTKLVGPMNASFWVGYRFKTCNFNEHFTAEPNNLDYYESYWEDYGFRVTERYFSDYHRAVTPSDPAGIWKKRLKRMLDRGYEIRTPTFSSFPDDLRDIYHMIVRLYASFPAFKPISEEQFVALYSSLRYVLDYESVLLGYKDGKLAGFFICVPNYGTLVTGDIRMRDLPKILRIRNGCKEYVVLYLGADPEHRGLGGAFAETSRATGERKQSSSIAALIHEGNSSSVFFRELTTHTARYVLMEKELELCI